MKAFEEKDLNKLLEKHDADDIMESMLVFALLEDLALGKTDPNAETKLKGTIDEYVNEEYRDKALEAIDESVFEIALDFYNTAFEEAGEEKISLKEFVKFFNHQIGKGSADQKEFENFSRKIRDAYQKIF